jgi:hypothetical protein
VANDAGDTSSSITMTFDIFDSNDVLWAMTTLLQLVVNGQCDQCGLTLPPPALWA